MTVYITGEQDEIQYYKQISHAAERLEKGNLKNKF